MDGNTDVVDVSGLALWSMVGGWQWLCGVHGYKGVVLEELAKEVAQMVFPSFRVGAN